VIIVFKIVVPDLYIERSIIIFRGLQPGLTNRVLVRDSDSQTPLYTFSVFSMYQRSKTWHILNATWSNLKYAYIYHQKACWRSNISVQYELKVGSLYQSKSTDQSYLKAHQLDKFQLLSLEI